MEGYSYYSEERVCLWGGVWRWVWTGYMAYSVEGVKEKCKKRRIIEEFKNYGFNLISYNVM